MAEDQKSVSEDLIESYANDALRLFRINLIVFGIVLSALALINQGMDERYLRRFFNSIYTLTAGLLWMGSMIASIASYRASRRLQLKEAYPERGAIPDENLHLNYISAVAFSSLLAVLSLIFGIFDGFSQGGITIDQPMGVVVLAFVFVTVSFSFFSTIDLLRDSAPSWVWDIFYARWGEVLKRLRK